LSLPKELNAPQDEDYVLATITSFTKQLINCMHAHMTKNNLAQARLITT
jgi:hypothetical protein